MPAYPAPCTYVLLAGLPGTGKSTLAQALSQRLSALNPAPVVLNPAAVVLNPTSVVLNKDELRAALFPGDATDYSEAQNDLCMSMLLQAADYLRRKPAPPRFILFDGRTFSHAAQIDPVLAAAEAGGSAWRILHLICPPAIAEQRLANQALLHPAADRTVALYRKLQAGFQPIQHPHCVLDTTGPLEASVTRVLQFLNAIPRQREW